MITPTQQTATSSTVWVAGGRPVLLRNERGRGGEGIIYDFGSGLAKIYRPCAIGTPSRMVELREKVEFLAKLPALQRDIRFGAPMLSIFSDAACRQWAGFAMRRCPGITMHAFGSIVGLQKNLPGWDRLHVTHAAASLVAALAALEGHGVLVADINPGNFLVDPKTGRVSCIDCDSYQVTAGSRVFPSQVFTPRYSSVEVLEASTPRPRTPQEYHYSCAILLFEILTHGLHPHSVRWGEDPVTNIRNGRTFIGGNRATGGLDPELFQRYNALYPAVKHLCVRTFVDGHRNPNARPTLADWQWALREQIRAFEAN
jgi:DNA-binding helix-hairpin-helix protein with protein kinase domain